MLVFIYILVLISVGLNLIFSPEFHLGIFQFDGLLDRLNGLVVSRKLVLSEGLFTAFFVLKDIFVVTRNCLLSGISLFDMFHLYIGQINSSFSPFLSLFCLYFLLSFCQLVCIHLVFSPNFALVSSFLFFFGKDVSFLEANDY